MAQYCILMRGDDLLSWHIGTHVETLLVIWHNGTYVEAPQDLLTHISPQEKISTLQFLSPHMNRPPLPQIVRLNNLLIEGLFDQHLD